MQEPHFIIIGETKCGTTSMYNYLIRHPKILDTFGNGEGYDQEYATKELRFLDRYYARGWDWYFSCFPKTREGEITGEATPMYMYRSQAAVRLKERLPNVKLIVLLRNPVERLISNFQHNIKWVPGWKEQYPSLKDYFYGCSDRDYYLIEKGIYYYSLLKWFDYFPIDQFCVVNSNLMFNEPEEVYLDILTFLGMEEYRIKDYPKYRVNSYNSVDRQLITKIEDFYRPYNRKLDELLQHKFNWYE